MRKKSTSAKLAEATWFSLAHQIVPPFVLLVGAVLCMGAIELLGGYKLRTAQNVGGVIMLGFVVLMVYSKAVLGVLEERPSDSVSDACASVFYSWTIYLQFIPMIGPLLAKRKLKFEAYRNPFVQGQGGD
jgi:hypothetical protein